MVANCVYRLLRLPLWMFQKLYERISDSSNARIEILGIRVRMAVSEEQVGLCRENLAAALALCKDLQPRVLRHLRAYVARIVVAEGRGPYAFFVPGSRSCYLSSELICSYPTPNVAVTLVHEATHARIHDRGILPLPGRVHRIERRCVKQEIAFAHQLPTGIYPSIGLWIENRADYLRSLQHSP